MMIEKFLEKLSDNFSYTFPALLVVLFLFGSVAYKNRPKKYREDNYYYNDGE